MGSGSRRRGSRYRCLEASASQLLARDRRRSPVPLTGALVGNVLSMKGHRRIPEGAIG